MSYHVPDYKLEPDDEQPVTFCGNCNGDLYEGDTVYNIDGDIICEGCLSDYFSSFKQILRGDKNETYR